MTITKPRRTLQRRRERLSVSTHICTTCQGKGNIQHPERSKKVCYVCGGTGIIEA